VDGIQIDVIRNNYLGIYVNSFVIRTKNENIFIDGGLYWNKDAYLSYADEGKPLSLILTHGHWDHLGCVALLKQKGATILAHQSDDKFWKDFSWHWKYLYGQYREEVQIPEARKSMFWDSIGQTVEVDKYLTDGAVYSMGGTDILVLHTPGHSPGHVCIFEQNTGTLFSGDTLLGEGFFGGMPMYMDVQSYLSSMRILKELKPSAVRCNHNDLMSGTDLQKKIDEGVEAVRQFGEAVEEFLKQKASWPIPRLGEVLSFVGQKMGKPVGPGGCISVLAHLEVLADSYPTANSIRSGYIIR
jgi:glyoxylase-like metal-dependent hydrolase (beta-lactamase superfamily II)